MSFESLTEVQRQWIEDYCNQTIFPEDFVRFEKELEASPELRAATRQYLALDANLQQGGESLADIENAWHEKKENKVVRFPRWIPIAAAAAIAFIVGIGYNRLFLGDTNSKNTTIASEAGEATAKGYAVVQGLIDVTTEDGTRLRAGDILGADTISLTEGSARIDFFSGAQIYVEAPARIEIRSAWEAAFHSGKLRAKVPPAARGFVIESNGRRIVDLGTEFGVDTSDEEVRVEVFSGKVELEDRELLMGQAVSLTRDGQTASVSSNIESFSNLFSIASGLDDSTRLSFERWQSFSETLSRDSRLIAYFPFASKPVSESDRVPSGLYPGDNELDGAVVLAEWVDGRWGGLKSAMEFRRPGSRVRVNVPGAFEAYTFSCWARIDSLDRRYNALFLADSYQTGEPHWQIRNDGVLMVGVMIDDQAVRAGQKDELGQPILGRSLNYYSPPFWDMTMSGQWIHLASVYDPVSRKAAHYVNGSQISEHEIEDDYFIDKLKIGNAEIGNWGDPNRKDPGYAIRNLNGRIDELAIFDVALNSVEIRALFEQGQSN